MGLYNFHRHRSLWESGYLENLVSLSFANFSLRADIIGKT